MTASSGALRALVPVYTGLRDEPRIVHAVYAADNLPTVCVKCGYRFGTWSGLVPDPEIYKPCEGKRKSK